MDWHAPTDMQRQVANMNWGCNINESWKDAAPARGNSYAYKPRLEQLILRPAQMDERINCNYGCQTTIKARLRKSKRVCEQILKQRTRRQVFCSTYINFHQKLNTNWIWYDCNFRKSAQAANAGGCQVMRQANTRRCLRNIHGHTCMDTLPKMKLICSALAGCIQNVMRGEHAGAAGRTSPTEVSAHMRKAGATFCSSSLGC